MGSSSQREAPVALAGGGDHCPAGRGHPVSPTDTACRRLNFIGLDVFRATPLPDVTGPNGEALSWNAVRDVRGR